MNVDHDFQELLTPFLCFVTVHSTIQSANTTGNGQGTPDHPHTGPKTNFKEWSAKAAWKMFHANPDDLGDDYIVTHLVYAAALPAVLYISLHP